MDAPIKRILGFVLLLTLVACSSPSTPPPAPVSTDSPVPSAIPALTADDLLNVNLSLTTLTGETPIRYQLKNGEYITPNGQTNISLLDQMAFGDLNNDGADDAAALVAENYGGSGTFISLIVFVNHNGSPVQAATASIGDRAIINDVSIEAGRVALQAVVHSFEDAMCCPTLETSRHYELTATGLLLRDFSTRTADDRWREIEITSPQDGEGATSLQVKGTVAVSPFENNLSYHVYDASGAELAAGPVPVDVTGTQLGSPGTFDTLILLNNAPKDGILRLEIQDLSPANGSLLAMDSVLLTIK